MDFIWRRINNRPTFVRPQSTVLQACEAAGIEVPRFCYHEKLSVAGNCRRCLVEVQKAPKPVVSCARPVSKGRVVYTNTPLVRKAREAVLEFLLINHPLDCPICDQGGECDLQDEALNYGIVHGRYFEFKRSVENKECGPIVKTIRTRCIHCTRCVRFSTEIAGYEILGSFGRGEVTEIGTYINGFMRTELSGNFVDLCPVGALTSKPYAYKVRSWELQRIDTIDFFDSLASDISVFTTKQTRQKFVNKENILVSQESIVRILPRTNGIYSENWITDRSRYAFDALNINRLITLKSKENSVSFSNENWSSFIDSFTNKIFTSNFISTFFSGKKYIGNPRYFFRGSQSNIERVYSLNSFLKLWGFSSINQGIFSVNRHFDAPEFYIVNRNIQNFLNGDFSGIFFIGVNLRYETSILNTRFRREQNRRSFFYNFFGVYQSVRYLQNHKGNSFRTLVSSIENRNFFIKENLFQKKPVVFFLGIETLRSNHGYFIQQFVSGFAKRFFYKNRGVNRRNYIHASIGSLAFADLGIKTKNSRTKFEINNSVDFFSVQQPKLSNYFERFLGKNIKTQIILDSHSNQNNFNIVDSKFNVNTSFNYYLPLNTLYEREGFIKSIDGRVRKHLKTITTVGDIRGLESILSVICLTSTVYHWFRWTESLSRFEDENPRNLLENTTIYFSFNLYAIEINWNFFSRIFIKQIIFHQTIRDFYLQEPIANNSSVRGACSLFLGHESNFIRES